MFGVSATPACADVVTKPTLDQGWRPAHQDDVDDRQPCSWCFPDADTTDEIDADLSDLVVSAKGSCVHRDETAGDPDYKHGMNKRRSLRRALASGDIDPDEIAADPVAGGRDG